MLVGHWLTQSIIIVIVCVRNYNSIFKEENILTVILSWNKQKMDLRKHLSAHHL